MSNLIRGNRLKNTCGYRGCDADIKTGDSGLMNATAEYVGIFLWALNDGSVFEEDEQKIYSSIHVYVHGGFSNCQSLT